MIKFIDVNFKNKTKTTNKSTFFKSKTKNVRLINVFCCTVEENSTQIIQKMLYTVVFNITVKDILIFKFITHKLIFKFNKSDIIIKTFNIEKISVKSI